MASCANMSAAMRDAKGKESRTGPKTSKKQPFQKSPQPTNPPKPSSSTKRPSSTQKSPAIPPTARKRPLSDPSPSHPSFIRAHLKPPPSLPVGDLKVVIDHPGKGDCSATSSSTHSVVQQGGAGTEIVLSPLVLTPEEDQIEVSPQKVETPRLKAKLRLVQSLAEITVKKLLDLKKTGYPSQPLEAVFAAFQSVLVRLDQRSLFPGISYYTWRTFQVYLQSPSDVLDLLHTSEYCVAKGLIDAGKEHTQD